MIVWCSKPKAGALVLVNKLNELGHASQLVVGGSPPPGALLWGRGGGNKYEELQKLAAAGVPVPAHGLEKKPGWLARTFKHREAKDLLVGLETGDYYVEYVETVREHRIHIFNGKSIRVAMKVPRMDHPHPVFRSYQAGWKFGVHPDYTALLPSKAREYAKKAVEALGYQFGAVDVGTTTEGKTVVWEVNSGPGIEASTVDCYARAVLGMDGVGHIAQ